MEKLGLLRTFTTYVATGSLSAAARQLGVTQPALTLQLRRLEAGMPQPLFVTRGRRKVLTPFGRALADAVAQPLSAVERAVERAIQHFADPAALTLRLGARRELWPAIAERLTFSGTTVFTPCTHVEVLERLEKSLVDIGVTHTPPVDPGYRSHRFFQDSGVLAIPASFLRDMRLPAAPAWDSEPLTHALRTWPALLYRSDAPLLRDLLTGLGLGIQQIRKRVYCEDWGTIVAMVRRGAGYAVMPSSHAGQCGKSVKLLPLPPDVCAPVTFHVVYRGALREIPAYRQVIDALTGDA